MDGSMVQMGHTAEAEIGSRKRRMAAVGGEDMAARVVVPAAGRCPEEAVAVALLGFVVSILHPTQEC